MPKVPFRYYLELAALNFKRSPWLTVAIVVTIGFGIGTSMTAFGLLHVLSADPLPGHSNVIYQPHREYTDRTRVPRTMVDYAEARDLLTTVPHEGRGTLISESISSTSGVGDNERTTTSSALHTTRLFFTIFRVPFLAGHAWSEMADEEGEHVAVITQSFARKVFGRTDVVGARLRYAGAILSVVGVLGDWQQQPRIYSLNKGGEFQAVDDIYTPIKVVRDLNSKAFVPFDCDTGDKVDQRHGAEVDGHNDVLFSSSCDWVSLWVELPSSGSVVAYRSFLTRRAQPGYTYALENIPTVLNKSGVVPVDVRIYTLLGFGFLLLCVLSSSGALLGKFFSRGFETGLHRALGASRMQILSQLLIEAALVGTCGGLIGLVLAYIGLANVRALRMSYSDVVRLDWTTLSITLAVSLASGLLAGLLPAWRASHVDPGLQIRTRA